MVHYISLHQLRIGTDDTAMDQLMLAVRIHLTKIHDVQGVRCGKNTDPNSLYGFFFALDCESRERLAFIQEDPNYLKMMQEQITPATWEAVQLVYEGEIGKNVRYS
jgi:hypothetical protein